MSKILYANADENRQNQIWTAWLPLEEIVKKYPDRPPNYKSVEDNEIVGDFDEVIKKGEKIDYAESLKQNIALAQRAKKILDEKKITYKFYDTGGKGVHMHTFWKDLDQLNDEQRVSARKIIVKWILGDEIAAKVDPSKLYGNMIGIADTPHRKTGKLKTLLWKSADQSSNVIPNDIKDKIYEHESRKILATQRIQREEQPFDVRIDEIVDLKLLKRRGEEEYSGSHPVHGSTTQMNFWVNIAKNTWHCFRCNSGGGPLSLFAVQKGIMECKDAHKGFLRGEKFKQTIEQLEKKLKKKLISADIQIDTIGQPRININEFAKAFENSHQHLELFDIVDAETKLIGEKYYVIKKFLCYYLMSSVERSVQIRVGSDYFDNRIHGIIVAPSGQGKGVCKNLIRHLLSDHYEISAPTKPEQWVGKLDRQGNEIPGLLRNKNVIFDEVGRILNEDEHDHKENMSILRRSADIYGLNMSDRKLVNDMQMLRYAPESLFLVFMHPQTLRPVFFSTGSHRRFFCFQMGRGEELNAFDAVKTMYDTPIQDIENKTLFADLIKYFNKPHIPVFTKESLDEMTKWLIAWSYFVCKHENPRLRFWGETTFYSIKQMFIKLISILSIWKKEKEVTVQTTQEACSDCVHFLLNTIEYYINNSNIELSIDIWKTSEFEEAIFLEWLHDNNAVSYEKSHINVTLALEAIGNFCGVQNRQAHRIFQKLKKIGLIQTRHSKHHSVVWLNFKPDLSSVSFNEDTMQNLLKVDSAQAKADKADMVPLIYTSSSKFLFLFLITRRRMTCLSAFPGIDEDLAQRVAKAVQTVRKRLKLDVRYVRSRDEMSGMSGVEKSQKQESQQKLKDFDDFNTERD